MTPTCPTCRVEMTEGFVLDRGHFDKSHIGVWVEGEPEFGFLGGIKLSDRRMFTMQAFRCAECGLLQLFANKREY